MNIKTIRAATLVLLLFMLIPMLCGCAGKNDTDTDPTASEKLSDEQALAAIRNYCYIGNPDLRDIENDGEYPVYWDISSSDEREIVVLFRSYTGAQIRFYIDRVTGDTYVTEYVAGITPEEQKTDESFNIIDYLSADQNPKTEN